MKNGGRGKGRAYAFRRAISLTSLSRERVVLPEATPKKRKLVRVDTIETMEAICLPSKVTGACVPGPW